MSTEMTITEALAEIKTITKRLGKKRAFVQEHLARESKFTDPFADSGGSKNVVKRELQSIGDLEDRMVALRSAINKCNQETSITIGAESKSVADWLAWRREVLPSQEEFLAVLIRGIQGARSDVSYGRRASATEDNTDVVVNIDEDKLNKDIEQLEKVVGTLDGQLSLINATTFIEVE